jgi:hypothetical protein
VAVKRMRASFAPGNRPGVWDSRMRSARAFYVSILTISKGHARGGGALIKVFEAMRSGDVYLVPRHCRTRCAFFATWMFPWPSFSHFFLTASALSKPKLAHPRGRVDPSVQGHTRTPPAHRIGRLEYARPGGAPFLSKSLRRCQEPRWRTELILQLAIGGMG